MTDEETTAVLEQEYFYHVTARKNPDSTLLEKGLDPEYSDWEMYRRWLKRPAVFLCTLEALPEAKRMFDNRIDRTPRVVIKVPAKAVSLHECDVDHSFPDLNHGLTFLECLAGWVYRLLRHDSA
jgi:hypothetical protein